MPPVAARHSNGEGSLRAIQALMCELGADPPGYFDPGYPFRRCRAQR